MKGFRKRVLAGLLTAMVSFTMVGADIYSVGAEEVKESTESINEPENSEQNNDGTEVAQDGPVKQNPEQKEEVDSTELGKSTQETESTEEMENTQESGDTEEFDQDGDGVKEQKKEQNMPAVTLVNTDYDSKITVSAEEGVLPEGVYMEVSPVTSETVTAAAADAAIENSSEDESVDYNGIIAYDITLFDAEGNEIQPADENKVSVTFSDLDADKADSVDVYHVSDDAQDVELMTTSKDVDEVEFDTTHFSIYVVVKKRSFPFPDVKVKDEDTSVSNPYEIEYNQVLKAEIDGEFTHKNSNSDPVVTKADGTDAKADIDTWITNDGVVVRTKNASAVGQTYKISCHFTGKNAMFQKKECDKTFYFKVVKNTPDFSEKTEIKVTYSGSPVGFSAESFVSNTDGTKSISYMDSSTKTPVAAPVNAGNYIMTVNAAETAKSKAAKKTYSLVVEKATPAVSVASNDDAYDGQILKTVGFNAKAAFKGKYLPGRFTWKDENVRLEKGFWQKIGNWISSNWGATCKATLVFVPDDLNNFNSVEVKRDIRVFKNGSSIKISASDMSYDPDGYKGFKIDEIMISGDSLDLSHKDNLDKIGFTTQYYKYSENEGWLAISGAPSAVGKYKVEVKIPTQTNQYHFKVLGGIFKQKDGYAGSSATKEFNITGADLPKNTVVAKDCEVIYDGNSHTIDVTSTLGGSITYAEDGVNAYSPVKPTYTEVGNYKIKFKVSVNNYNDYYGFAYVNIKPLDLTNDTKTSVAVEDVFYKASAYSGSELKGNVSYDGKTLVQNKDYTIEVKGNCTDSGKRTAEIQFTGNYSGKKDAEYSIIGKKVKYFQKMENGSYVSVGEGAFSEEKYRSSNDFTTGTQTKTIYSGKQSDAEIRQYYDSSVAKPVIKNVEQVKFIKLCTEKDGNEYTIHIDFESADSSTLKDIAGQCFVRKAGVKKPDQLISDSSSNYVLLGNCVFTGKTVQTADISKISSFVKTKPDTEAEINEAIRKAGFQYSDEVIRALGIHVRWYRIVKHGGWHLDGEVVDNEGRLVDSYHVVTVKSVVEGQESLEGYIKVLKGSKISDVQLEALNLYRSGYKLSSWESEGTAFDLNSAITKDQTIYAMYTKDQSGGTTSGGGDTTPGGGDTTPGGGDTTPGGGDTTPGGGDTTPGGGDTTSGGSDQTPGGGDTTSQKPGKADSDNNNHPSADNRNDNNANSDNNRARNNRVNNNNAPGNTTPVVVNTDGTNQPVEIVDEETPLAANEETDVAADNANDDQNVTNIEDEKTPLASVKDRCFIHWIILLLTLVAGIYSVIRTFVRGWERRRENQ